MGKRKSLVTGGAGFIGSHLVDYLIRRGDDVTVIDNFRTGRHQFVNSNAKLVNHDLNNLDSIKSSFKGIDDVYHLAANADVRRGWDDPRRDFHLNLEITLSVAELSADYEIENFIFASTGSVYGEAAVIPTPEHFLAERQTSLYAASKFSCEAFLGAYAEAQKFAVTILRLVSILGPRYTHGHVLDFIKLLKRDPYTLNVLGDGNQEKSYLHVTDCINAMVKLRGKKNFEVFNVGRSETLSVKQSISIITSTLNLRPQTYFGMNRQGWIGDNPVILLDSSKAQMLGWKSEISIASAIKETASWIAENPWVMKED